MSQRAWPPNSCIENTDLPPCGSNSQRLSGVPVLLLPLILTALLMSHSAIAPVRAKGINCAQFTRGVEQGRAGPASPSLALVISNVAASGPAALACADANCVPPHHPLCAFHVISASGGSSASNNRTSGRIDT